VKLPQFKAINALLGNLKSAISRTYHAFDFAKYAHRYRAEFQYRFNRRFNMKAILSPLLTARLLHRRCPSASCGLLRLLANQVMESLGDSKGVTIRAIRADDNERIVRAFRALEPRSVYLRFFSYKKEVGGHELRRLTEPDRARDVVLVATIGSGNDETIIGLGHYVRSGPSADIAFIVEEDYQGRGIASRLLRNLAHLARANGIAQFEADVLVENIPMLNALRHSGLPVRESESDGIVHMTLFLGDCTGNA
jgi:RimJ/RimL family protein N-acetyltransferase